MTKTLIFGAFAAIIAVMAMIMMPSAVAATQNPLTVTDSEITTYTWKGTEYMKAKLTVDVKHIQKFIFKTNAAFGYGLVTKFVDGGPIPDNVLVMATHVCASDSPYQGNARHTRCPDPVGLGAFTDKFVKRHDGQGMHPHVLDLMPSTQACIDAIEAKGLTPLLDALVAGGLEVDLANSVATNGGLEGVSPNYLTFAFLNKVVVGNVPTSVLGDPSNAENAAVVPFGIIGLATNGDITNLCLTEELDV